MGGRYATAGDAGRPLETLILSGRQMDFYHVDVDVDLGVDVYYIDVGLDVYDVCYLFQTAAPCGDSLLRHANAARSIEGKHLSNTTCLTHVCFKSGE